MNEINEIIEIDQKDISMSNWLLMAWAAFWRGFVVSLGALLTGAIIGGIVGFIVGVVCSIIKVPIEHVTLPLQIVCGLMGFISGFFFVVLQLKWLFRAKFNGFRIAIVKSENN